MNKSIKIVYEDFSDYFRDEGRSSNIKVAEIQFNRESTIEYDGDLSYSENMDELVKHIMNDGYVFVGKNSAISIFVIKQFLSNEVSEINIPKQTQLTQNLQKQGRHYKKWRKDRNQRQNLDNGKEEKSNLTNDGSFNGTIDPKCKTDLIAEVSRTEIVPNPMLCFEHGGSAICERVNLENGFACPMCEEEAKTKKGEV